MPFKEQGMLEWIERIRDISGLNLESLEQVNEQKVNNGYKRIDETRLKLLQKKYQFDYVITEKTVNLPELEIYSNSQYSLFS